MKLYFLFLVGLVPSLVHAVDEDKVPKITNFGPYKIIVTPNCKEQMDNLGKPAGYKTCLDGKIEVFGPNNYQQNILPPASTSGLNVAIYAGKLYRADTSQSITVQELKPGSVPQVIFDKEAKCETAVFLKQGNLIACKENGKISILDIVKKQRRPIFPAGPNATNSTPEEYDFDGVSTNENLVWASVRDLDGGIVSMCSHDISLSKSECYGMESSINAILEKDRGIVVDQNFPVEYGDPVDVASLRKEKVVIKLTARDLKLKKRLVLDSAIANDFSPNWKNGILSYSKNGKILKISADEIVAKIKSSKP